VRHLRSELRNQRDTRACAVEMERASRASLTRCGPGNPTSGASQRGSRRAHSSARSRAACLTVVFADHASYLPASRKALARAYPGEMESTRAANSGSPPCRGGSGGGDAFGNRGASLAPPPPPTPPRKVEGLGVGRRRPCRPWVPGLFPRRASPATGAGRPDAKIEPIPLPPRLNGNSPWWCGAFGGHSHAFAYFTVPRIIRPGGDRRLPRDLRGPGLCLPLAGRAHGGETPGGSARPDLARGVRVRASGAL
jgi:hypothetical protein